MRGRAVVGCLAVLAGVLLPAAASPAETLRWYFVADELPIGSLATRLAGGELPNLDLGRDIHPGLRLERSELGSREATETRFQQWQTAMGGARLFGYPSVVLWAAPADFDEEAAARFVVYLLDCPPFGHRCTELGEAEGRVEEGDGSGWTEHLLTYPKLDHRFDEGRHLAVKVVVPPDSEADLIIAFGYPSYRSRVTFSPTPATTTIPETAPDASVAAIEITRDGTVPDRAVTGAAASGDPVTAPSRHGWIPGVVVNGLLLSGLGMVLLGMLPASRGRRGRHTSPPRLIHR